MRKCQFERPAVSEILQMDSVRIMASKLGIYLPPAKVSQKLKTVEQDDYQIVPVAPLHPPAEIKT